MRKRPFMAAFMRAMGSDTNACSARKDHTVPNIRWADGMGKRKAGDWTSPLGPPQATDGLLVAARTNLRGRGAGGLPCGDVQRPEVLNQRRRSDGVGGAVPGFLQRA
jgi:hypothetical protein